MYHVDKKTLPICMQLNKIILHIFVMLVSLSFLKKIYTLILNAVNQILHYWQKVMLFLSRVK